MNTIATTINTERAKCRAHCIYMQQISNHQGRGRGAEGREKRTRRGGLCPPSESAGGSSYPPPLRGQGGSHPPLVDWPPPLGKKCMYAQHRKKNLAIFSLRSFFAQKLQRGLDYTSKSRGGMDPGTSPFLLIGQGSCILTGRATPAWLLKKKAWGPTSLKLCPPPFTKYRCGVLKRLMARSTPTPNQAVSPTGHDTIATAGNSAMLCTHCWAGCWAVDDSRAIVVGGFMLLEAAYCISNTCADAEP